MVLRSENDFQFDRELNFLWGVLEFLVCHFELKQASFLYINKLGRDLMYIVMLILALNNNFRCMVDALWDIHDGPTVHHHESPSFCCAQYKAVTYRHHRSLLATHSHMYICHPLSHTTLHSDTGTLTDSSCRSTQQDRGYHNGHLSILADSRMYHPSCYMLHC